MLTEIVCIIDRSGSMHTIRDDAIGGFNRFLEEQKAVEGDARLTLVMFNHQYTLVHYAIPLADVPPLSGLTFIPSGNTALHDAIGRTIDAVGMHLDGSAVKPDKVIVLILTDGMENCSTDYSRQRIAEMIKHQHEKYSWEFVFLAANQDAIASGAGMGIDAKNSINFSADAAGTSRAYDTMSEVTRNYRTK